MDECPHGNLPEQIRCILTYGGSADDIAINYALLILNSLYAYSLLSHVRYPQRYGYTSLIFVAIFQVTLCIILGCSGISIIWCAILGWIWNELLRTRSNLGVRWPLLFVINGAAIVWYAVTMEPITTVAHACAIILGALLSVAATRFAGREQLQDDVPVSLGVEETRTLEDLDESQTL